MSRRDQRKSDRRVVRRAQKRLRQAGVLDRMDAVRLAVQSEFFARAAGAAFTRAASRGGPVTSAEDIRGVCMQVLAQVFPELDRRDVQLNFAWDPETRKLEVYVHPSAEAAVVAIAAAQGAARGEL